MKSIALALLTLVTIQSAQARSLMPATRYADLTDIRLQAGTEIAKRNIESGRVTVDFVTNKIQVVLVERNTCPKNAFCAAVVGPIAHPFEAVMVNRSTDSCGARHYVAETDQRPVDGALVKIEVVDNRYMTCEIPVTNLTEVHLTVQGPRDPWAELHYLGGGALVLGAL